MKTGRAADDHGGLPDEYFTEYGNVAAMNEVKTECGSIEPAYREAVQGNNIGILLALAGDFIATIAFSIPRRHR